MGLDQSSEAEHISSTHHALYLDYYAGHRAPRSSSALFWSRSSTHWNGLASELWPPFAARLEADGHDSKWTDRQATATRHRGRGWTPLERRDSGVAAEAQMRGVAGVRRTEQGGGPPPAETPDTAPRKTRGRRPLLGPVSCPGSYDGLYGGLLRAGMGIIRTAAAASGRPAAKKKCRRRHSLALTSCSSGNEQHQGDNLLNACSGSVLSGRAWPSAAQCMVEQPRVARWYVLCRMWSRRMETCWKKSDKAVATQDPWTQRVGVVSMIGVSP